MKTNLFTFFLLATLACFETAQADHLVPITIQEITTSGEACPEGTASITLAPDQRSFSILFDQAHAESSTDVPLDNKICELTIVSHVPAGWKFDLHGLDYRGFSQVDPGSRTFQRTSYYRLNPNNKWILFKRSKKQFNANFADNYIVQHAFKVQQPRSVRCTDHTEVIKVQLQFVAHSSTRKITSSQLSLDSVDGTIKGVKEVCAN